MDFQLSRNWASSSSPLWNLGKMSLETSKKPYEWTFSNDLLKKKDILPFDFQKDDPDVILRRMKQVLIETGGLGLSANQIGIDRRVFMLGSQRDGIQYVAYFNPTITFLGPEKETQREGCLSFPGLFLMIQRSTMVRLRHQNEKGDFKANKFEGIGARIVQHEMDHLNGITFQERASKYALERGMKHMRQGRFNVSKGNSL